METIERIQHYERLLDAVAPVLKDLETALDRFDEVQAAVQEYPMALPPALEETVDSLRARIKATRRLVEKAQGIPVQQKEKEQQ